MVLFIFSKFESYQNGITDSVFKEYLCIYLVFLSIPYLILGYWG